MMQYILVMLRHTTPRKNNSKEFVKNDKEKIKITWSNNIKN